MTGILYIVPTPIGNLSDMSQRAVDVLNSVDTIAAEDTRHSGLLLQHYGVKTKTLSVHEHNESQRATNLVTKLLQGESVALISDAGTPLISDPGYVLVNACREAGIVVTALPGPCALTTALSASGLPTDKFVYLGFLPVKQVAKEAAILECVNYAITCIFYEAPRRIKDTIELCKLVLPSNHKIVLAKELSKHFERYVSGNADEILVWLNEDPAHQKGEFVLMIYCPKESAESLPQEVQALVKRLLPLLPPKQVAAIVSEQYSVNKKRVYEFGLSLKDAED